MTYSKRKKGKKGGPAPGWTETNIKFHLTNHGNSVGADAPNVQFAQDLWAIREVYKKKRFFFGVRNRADRVVVVASTNPVIVNYREYEYLIRKYLKE